jgi:ABC transport system ATP-binding/permease protein
LLEDLLQNYDGTVFLVSHDRAFLDNVVTSTIVFEGNGAWREYEGGVEDWLVQSRRARALALAAASATNEPPAPARRAAEARPASSGNGPSPRKKLGYKERRELDALPDLIDALEQEQKAIHGELSDGSLYLRDAERAQRLTERSAQIEDDLMAALERWEALSGGS